MIRCDRCGNHKRTVEAYPDIEDENAEMLCPLCSMVADAERLGLYED